MEYSAMTGKIFVKPAVEGAIVRQVDRDMRVLPQEGAWVADTMLWRRLIHTGDVVEAEPVETHAAKEPAPLGKAERARREAPAVPSTDAQ